MTKSVLLKATAIWLVILILAIFNGALRENMLIPVFGGYSGLIISGITLSFCIFLVALIAAPVYGPLLSKDWLLLGLFWLTLTVVFEFGFGLFVQHKTWDELFEAYTFTDGNLWPLILFITLISPWLAAKIRRLI